MATYMARHQIPPPSHSDLPSNTPPDHALNPTNSMHRRSMNQLPPNPRIQHRLSGEYRINGAANFANGNGTMPVSAAPHTHMANGGPRNGGLGAFDGPRSPPSTKSMENPPGQFLGKQLIDANADTSHVPCKFFKVGQCQAGKACPFSHSTDMSKVDTPCKYFSKGNCKFGAKCALAHVLPNGRIVNKPPHERMGGQLNLGGRVDPPIYHHQTDSALANSILAQQANDSPGLFNHQLTRINDIDPTMPFSQHNQSYSNLPTIDTAYTSHSESKFGSPREDSRLSMSPGVHLSALDAPMPASFDSQGISYMARHGPVAASMPSKFGLDSPSSLPKKTALPSDTLRNLHDSAYGRDNTSRASQLGSSPSTNADEYSGQRMMHSQRVSRPKMLSASLPRTGATDDWDDGLLFGGEEDFLPTALSELLTPEEKIRRFSRTEQDRNRIRDGLSGHGTPAEASSKVGSPSTASPSRFGALFARQKREEEFSSLPNSAFGHVGSPLRNSSLHSAASPSLRAVNRSIPGDLSPRISSPPRHSSMSMISQQLQRTRLSKADANDSSSGLHPVSARLSSNSSSRLDRAVSSSSIGNSKIDEEQGDCVFSFDEEYSSKRNSGGWNQFNGRRSPYSAAIGQGRHGKSSINAQGGEDGKMDAKDSGSRSRNTRSGA